MSGGLEDSDSFVVGTKQTLKAIKANKATKVYIACDADEHIIRPVLQACRERQLEPTMVSTRYQLGRQCCIEVGAAAAALVKDVKANGQS